ncbi:MAG: DNA ligase, partial [Pseudomonadota bacterium]
IRDYTPDNAAWQSVKFMVFDAPRAPGHFSQRQQYLSNLLSNNSDAWVQLVPQQRVSTNAALQAMLKEITSAGAEGLMLQREDLHYLAGRHYGLLKLKTTDDDEATVIAHRQGRGKYKDVLGSLLVENKEGVRFRIGSGFTDKERANPPPIGSIITFRYQGRTNSGKPRFARYLRTRPPE